MQDTRPKPFVFVLMPFHESFDDVYKLGIKPACQAAGAYCERVDEQIFQESILDRIYNQIAKADLIVSDMSDRNPNVFYETGYAHALGKKVILLTQQSDDIPFDLLHYPQIIYEGKITYLRDELEHRVSWYIDQPIASVVETHLQLKFFAHGQEIQNGVEVTIPQGDYTFWAWAERGKKGARVYLSLSVHNPSNRVIELSEISLALILPPAVRSGMLRLPDGRGLSERRALSRMLPLDWKRFVFEVSLRLNDDEVVPCALRIFTPTGITDIQFAFRLEPTPTPTSTSTPMPTPTNTATPAPNLPKAKRLSSSC